MSTDKGSPLANGPNIKSEQTSNDTSGEKLGEKLDEKPKIEEVKLKPGHRKQPEVLCGCPQKCGDRIPQTIKKKLYDDFWQLGDHHRQNIWLQSNIEMRSVYKRLWCQEERVGGRLQRRVSCKYRVPLDANLSIINNICKGDVVEVCQKAFMNLYGITEKRIRIQRERLISSLRSDLGSGDVVVDLVTDRLDDPDLIDRLDLFFRNQLWKPEYINGPNHPT